MDMKQNEDIFIPSMSLVGDSTFPTQTLYKSDIAFTFSKSVNGNKYILDVVKNRLGVLGKYETIEDIIPIISWILSKMRTRQTGTKFLEEVIFEDIKLKIFNAMKDYIEEGELIEK